jgi:hypothetical protein
VKGGGCGAAGGVGGVLCVVVVCVVLFGGYAGAIYMADKISREIVRAWINKNNT